MGFYKGMILYHKNNETQKITQVKVKNVYKDKLLVSLEAPISKNNNLETTFRLNVFGKWLFFEEEDIRLGKEKLVQDERYLFYGTDKVKKYIRRNKQGASKNHNNYNQKKDLINYLKNHPDFNGFIHYTNFTNFIKILKDGKLFSRNSLHKNSFFDSANTEVIGKTKNHYKNYVRLFYKENTPTTYRNIGIKLKLNTYPYHMPIPVILRFSETLINRDDILFLNGGAYNPEKHTPCAKEARAFDWETIFSRGPISGEDYERKIVKTARNAEFLVNKSININQIKSIVFRSPADLKVAKLLSRDVFQFERIVNPKLFETDYKNINYLVDYKVNIKESCINIELKLYNQLEEFKHELIIHSSDGNKSTYDIGNAINCREYRSILKVVKQFRNFNIVCMNPIKDIQQIDYRLNGFEYVLWKGSNND